MRHFFHERTLRRRAVALVAAYAIALASLLATFTAARAAADSNNGADNTLGVICHTVDPGQTAPAGGTDNGKACAENCCIGCLMLTAALPPPPVKVTGAPETIEHLLSPLEVTPLASGTFTKTHRSRAPPLTA